jgi:hypothetical protein
MKAIFPATTTWRKRLIPPEKFFYFGDSTRFKIIKAFQAHQQLPPITEDTEQFIPFFDLLSENVQGHWTVQQQYSAAKFASQWDKSLAASLLLHYGWSTRMEPRMLGSSMHAISVIDTGILIDMTYTHTFQERVEAACFEAKQKIFEAETKNIKLDIEAVRSAALTRFYWHKNKFVSLQNDYSMGVKSKIQSYIDSIMNPMRENEPQVPEIDEPEDMLDDETILLKWEDFEIDIAYTKTSAAYEQRQDNNRRASYEAFMKKMAHYPRGVPIYRQDFPTDMPKAYITAWLKFGFVIPAGKDGTKTLYIIPDEGDE